METLSLYWVILFLLIGSELFLRSPLRHKHITTELPQGIQYPYNSIFHPHLPVFPSEVWNNDSYVVRGLELT